jgi:hypothetical protein
VNQPDLAVEKPVGQRGRFGWGERVGGRGQDQETHEHGQNVGRKLHGDPHVVEKLHVTGVSRPLTTRVSEMAQAIAAAAAARKAALAKKDE